MVMEIKAGVGKVKEYVVKLYRSFEGDLAIELEDAEKCWELAKQWTSALEKVCMEKLGVKACQVLFDKCIVKKWFDVENAVLEPETCEKLRKLYTEMETCFEEIKELEERLIDLSKKGKVKLVIEEGGG